jgi:hypothetical protein
MLYDRPIYYAISHILIGFIAVWYPILGVIGVIYQLAQYILNVRFFPVEGTWRPGNNLYHTGIKLLEMGLGYILGYIIKNGLPTI